MLTRPFFLSPLIRADTCIDTEVLHLITSSHGVQLLRPLLPFLLVPLTLSPSLSLRLPPIHPYLSLPQQMHLSRVLDDFFHRLPVWLKRDADIIFSSNIISPCANNLVRRKPSAIVYTARRVVWRRRANAPACISSNIMISQFGTLCQILVRFAV